MAFVTGTASSFADLLTAIQSACTSNGWLLDGGVLHKGTCYVDITNVGDAYLQIRGGTGVSGGALTGVATGANPARLGVGIWKGLSSPERHDFSFPVTYFAHVLASPDEVHVVVRHSAQFYERMSWGRSVMPGLTGSGNWYSGCFRGNYGYNFTNGIEADPSSYGTFGLFAGTGYAGVDHALDSPTWTVLGARGEFADVMYRTPTSWGAGTVLMPIRVYAGRPSGFISAVLECAHARFVNVSNLVDEQIVTLGPDRWKIYPWLSRGANPIPNNQGVYSGVCGHAIRYDGP